MYKRVVMVKVLLHFLDFDMDSGGSAGTNNVVLGGVNNVDFLVDTNNNGTTGAFVFGKDANTMSSGTQLMTLDESRTPRFKNW